MENKASDRTPPSRLYPDHPSIAIPVQDLQSVGAAITENQQVPGEGLQWVTCSAIIDNPSKERRMAYGTVHR